MAEGTTGSDVTNCEQIQEETILREEGRLDPCPHDCQHVSQKSPDPACNRTHHPEKSHWNATEDIILRAAWGHNSTHHLQSNLGTQQNTTP